MDQPPIFALDERHAGIPPHGKEDGKDVWLCLTYHADGNHSTG